MTGNLWQFALGFVLVAAIVAALIAADRSKRSEQCPSPTTSSAGAGSLNASAIGAPSMASNGSSGGVPVSSATPALPIEAYQDGYYRTVNDIFYGQVPNAQAKPDLYPNEEMLDQIRREYYHYRERISNRNNLNSYQYPNKMGWWPRASYSGNVRLEPGQWPKYDNPPFSVAWRSGVQPCGPDNPATFGGENNEGVPVNMFGRLVRRGQCVGGRADCPMGMVSTGGTCVGEAARDAFGQLIWSRTEFASPLTDVADVYTAAQLQGQELGTPVGFY